MDKFKVFGLTGPNVSEVPDIGKFPGGEIRVRLAGRPNADIVRIEAYLFNSDDIMTLVMLTDALRRMGCRHIRLTMPYTPYARQDRVCNEGEALSIAAFANIINSLEFSSVVIYDPHSEVTPALINNCLVESQSLLMSKHDEMCHWLATRSEPTYLVSPDAGASKKVYDIFNKFGRGNFAGIVFAEKRRDLATGKIIKTNVTVPCDEEGNCLIDGANLLIADDICDGGRTFIELAKVLVPYAPKSMSLYVTHGIFSQGLSVLKKEEAYSKSEPDKILNIGGPFDNVWSTINFAEAK